MSRLFTLFLLSEAAYIAAARLLTHTFTGSLLHQELCRSGLRLLSAAVLLWLFRQLLANPPSPPAPPAALSPRHLLAAGMFLAPLLVGEQALPSPERHVFAATSLIVGLREELAYRALLQRLLGQRYGFLPALLLSNLAFVAYHYGVQPFGFHYVLQLFLAGLILGLVYHVSGSLLLVIALHTIYDAIDSYSPFLSPPLPYFVCNVVLASTFAALLLAYRRSLTAPHR